jgi:hypothetical protein
MSYKKIAAIELGNLLIYRGHMLKLPEWFVKQFKLKPGDRIELKVSGIISREEK